MAEVRGEKDVSSFKKSAFKNFVADKSLFSNMIFLMQNKKICWEQTRSFFSHLYLKLSSSSRQNLLEIVNRKKTVVSDKFFMFSIPINSCKKIA